MAKNIKAPNAHIKFITSHTTQGKPTEYKAYSIPAVPNRNIAIKEYFILVSTPSAD
jgi:hypothetical protein